MVLEVVEVEDEVVVVVVVVVVEVTPDVSNQIRSILK